MAANSLFSLSSMELIFQEQINVKAFVENSYIVLYSDSVGSSSDTVSAAEEISLQEENAQIEERFPKINKNNEYQIDSCSPLAK